MKATKVLLLAGVVVVLTVSVGFVRSCGAGNRLDIDPNAQREIDKAKQR